MSNLRKFNIKIDSLDFEFDFNSQEKNNIHNELSNNPKLNMDDVRRVALWKLNRVINIPDELIKKLNDLATDINIKTRDKKSTEVIDELVKCEGIGFPIASTILKFLRPDIYPIIDIRAYRALKARKLYNSSYNLELYLNYIDEINQISKLLQIPLSSIDEQLYEFDKKHNGKI